MGRKIAVVAVILSLITGCADFYLHIKNDGVPVKAGKILIGTFEFRNMSYDPYISAEYREALRYEFFRRGIKPYIIADISEPIRNESEAAALAGKYSGDVLICGVISQRESGFLTEREISTSVSFIVYSAEGREIGEGYYYVNDPASDESVKRDAAGKFVNKFLTFTNIRQ